MSLSLSFLSYDYYIPRGSNWIMYVKHFTYLMFFFSLKDISEMNEFWIWKIYAGKSTYGFLSIEQTFLFNSLTPGATEKLKINFNMCTFCKEQKFWNQTNFSFMLSSVNLFICLGFLMLNGNPTFSGTFGDIKWDVCYGCHTEYPRLGGLNNRIYFLIVLEATSQISGCHQVWFFLRPHLGL